ncbi:MAG: NAD(P)/FAD-dependent oxidoreductase [Candidatus Hodarchaeota archaeon]
MKDDNSPSPMSDPAVFDVLIVGGGPAGIFTAMELIKQSDLKIAILEKGKPLDKRHCPATATGHCQKCNPCSMLNGWGGSGAFSDGKLTLTWRDVGGWLHEYITKDLDSLIQEVDQTFLEFGVPENRLFNPSKDPRIVRFKRQALLSGVELIPYKIRHIGSDKTSEVLQKMYDWLVERGVQILFRQTVSEILTNNGKVTGVKVAGPPQKTYSAQKVILAVGRQGAKWLREEATRLGLRLVNNPVDVGVRVEIPAEIAAPLTDILYEFKCKFFSPSFDQLTRTFCVCPYGEVTIESYEDVLTVNGHSNADEDTRTLNTNFAILVTSQFTEPFDDPIAYGVSIASLANMLSGGGVIVQRLADLKRGRRSNDSRMERSIVTPTLKGAVPGDLSFVLPERHLRSILEMIEALDSIIPGIDSGNTLLYGVEAKFYSSKLELNGNLETQIQGLYAVGDGAGVTRSLVHACVSGLVVARSILQSQ